ncbi:Uncharacterized protein TCM_009968 [Theobroma cacao]|uniref:Uncharacterized protein n=1 Tax=Theobroma cacao TaxID=3641 RepID=A0A061E5H8_THECC|nr:Uncharacterized protein TCM_009968 [Theobroma cacao]
MRNSWNLWIYLEDLCKQMVLIKSYKLNNICGSWAKLVRVKKWHRESCAVPESSKAHYALYCSTSAPSLALGPKGTQTMDEMTKGDMERTWTSGPTKIAYMCDDSPERRKNLRLELKKETLVCLSQPTNPTISTSRAPLGHIDQSPGSHFHCNSYPVSVPPRNRLKGSDTWKGKDPTFLPIPMSFLCYQALAATLHRFCPFDWPPVGPIAP